MKLFFITIFAIVFNFPLKNFALVSFRKAIIFDVTEELKSNVFLGDIRSEATDLLAELSFSTKHNAKQTRYKRHYKHTIKKRRNYKKNAVEKNLYVVDEKEKIRRNNVKFKKGNYTGNYKSNR